MFHGLVLEAIQSGTEETLIAALRNPAYWDRHKIYYQGRARKPLTSVMGMKRRRLACCHLLQDAV